MKRIIHLKLYSKKAEAAIRLVLNALKTARNGQANTAKFQALTWGKLNRDVTGELILTFGADTGDRTYHKTDKYKDDEILQMIASSFKWEVFCSPRCWGKKSMWGHVGDPTNFGEDDIPVTIKDLYYIYESFLKRNVARHFPSEYHNSMVGTPRDPVMIEMIRSVDAEIEKEKTLCETECSNLQSQLYIELEKVRTDFRQNTTKRRNQSVVKIEELEKQKKELLTQAGAAA